MLYQNRFISRILISNHLWISLRNKYHFSRCIFLVHEVFLCSTARCTHLHLCTFLDHVLPLKLEQINLHTRCFYVYELLCLAVYSWPINLHNNLLLEISKLRIHFLYLASIILRKFIRCSKSIFLHHVLIHWETHPYIHRRCFFRIQTFWPHFQKHLRKFTWVR